MCDASVENLIRVHCIPRFADYLRLQFRVPLRRGLLLAPALVLLMLLRAAVHELGPPTSTTVGADSTLGVGLGLLLGSMVLDSLLTFFVARRRWRHARELNSPCVYEFSDDGIRIDSPVFDYATSWEDIVSVSRMGSKVVMQNSQGQCYLVPVCAFHSRAQWDSFRELVRSRVTLCRLGGARWTRFTGEMPPATVERAATVQRQGLGQAAAVVASEGLDAGNAIRVHDEPMFGGFLRVHAAAIGQQFMEQLAAIGVAILLLLRFLDADEAADLFLSEPWIVPIILLPLLAGEVAIAVALLSWRWARSNPVHAPRTYVFSETGIQVEATSYAGLFKWGMIKTIEKRGSTIVLLTAQNSSMLVGRAGFRHADWPKFCELAKAKVRECQLR
jgi:hypothetical protein